MPGPRDVSLMDEALSWVLLIPNQTKRRVVSLRSQYHPLRERHVMSWRACGTSLRISDKSAQRWHAEALAFLEMALAGWEVKIPPAAACWQGISAWPGWRRKRPLFEKSGAKTFLTLARGVETARA